MPWERKTISVDGDYYRRASELLKSKGLNISRFLDLTLRSLVDSEIKPFATIQQELYDGILQDALNTQKKEMRGGYRPRKKK